MFFDLGSEEFFISKMGSEKMAEREGFEPSVRSPPRSLSKGVLSTTQPSLHDSVFGRAFDTQNSCSSSTISEDFFDYFFPYLHQVVCLPNSFPVLDSFRDATT